MATKRIGMYRQQESSCSSGGSPSRASVKGTEASVASLQRELRLERERTRRARASVVQLRLELKMMAQLFAATRKEPAHNLTHHPTHHPVHEATHNATHNSFSPTRESTDGSSIQTGGRRRAGCGASFTAGNEGSHRTRAGAGTSGAHACRAYSTSARGPNGLVATQRVELELESARDECELLKAQVEGLERRLEGVTATKEELATVVAAMQEYLARGRREERAANRSE